MLRALLLASLLSIGPANLMAQERGAPEAAKPAPPLGVEHWVQPAGATAQSWKDFRGAVVVLEFWATWCGPCVAAIPHLNELAEKFRDKPVTFLSVSDEEEPVVKKFLASRPIQGWVGIDRDKSMFDAYGVEGIPHTVLINSDGNIIGVTGPEQITEAILNEVLAGNVATVVPKLKRPPSLVVSLRASDEVARAMFEAIIRPARPGSSAMQRNPYQFAARSMSLKNAISNAYNVSPPRMVVPDWLAETLYDFLITVPKERPEALLPTFQRALETTFGLLARRETREVDVYLLIAPQGHVPWLHPSSTAGMIRSEKGKITATSMPLRSLASMLERALNRPVLDETGLTEKYDYELSWDEANPESLLAAVRTQLGLELRPARSPVELLTIETQARAAKP